MVPLLGLVGWEWDFAVPVGLPELNLANPLDGAPRISFSGSVLPVSGYCALTPAVVFQLDEETYEPRRAPSFEVSAQSVVRRW